MSAPFSRSVPRPRLAAHGSVAVAVIAALLVVEIAVVGSILTLRREQDLTVQRLDTERAFYAAEAGMNMAIAEMMAGEDRDGDGGVGSVSNDGDPVSDPALGTARVCVTLSGTGPVIVRSEGRSGNARRVIAAEVW